MRAADASARREPASPGRRRLGAAALRNELAKMVRRPATLVVAGLMLFVAGMQFGYRWWEGVTGEAAPFALPGAWSEILGAQVARPGLIFGALLVVLLAASEFSWRTARQNIIDGLSREAWFRGKVYLLAMVAGVFLLLQVVPGLAFAAAGTDALTTEALLPGVHQLSAAGGYMLAFLGYGSLALLVALAVRSPGASVGVWLLYVAVGERLIVTVLQAVPVPTGAVARFLPIGLFNELVVYLHHDPVARAEAASTALARGASPPPAPDWGFLLPVAVCWIAVFLAAAYAACRWRDL